MRNSHGPHLLFVTDKQHPYDFTFKNNEVIKNCVAKVENIDMNDFHISFEKVKFGLLKGIKWDFSYRGFPTLQHIPHSGQLEDAGVQVFNFPSRTPSMILKILPRADFEKVYYLFSKNSILENDIF